MMHLERKQNMLTVKEMGIVVIPNLRYRVLDPMTVYSIQLAFLISAMESMRSGNLENYTVS